MQIKSIALHEFRYGVQSVQWLVVFGAFFGFGFLMTANGSEFQSVAKGGQVFANSAYTITSLLIAASIFSLFIVPTFVGQAILKDVEHQFEGILFSTPLKKHSFLAGRFTGAFAALSLALAGAPLGLWLGTLWPLVDPVTLGPTPIGMYIYGFFVVILPSVFAPAAIIFSVAVLSRRTLFTYVAALCLLVLYLALGETNAFPAVWDPFMFDVFEEQTQYWTAMERNTLAIGLEGKLLLNRLLWVGLGLGFLTLAYGRFSFERATATKQKRVRCQPKSIPLTQSPSAGVPRKAPSWQPWTAWVQLASRVRFEMGAVVKSMPFLVLSGFSVFLLLVAFQNREVMYGVNAYPLTRLMVGAITSSLVWALLGVLVFYSAEIVGRERKHGFHAIMDALPTPNWVFVIGKLAALLALMGALVVIGVVLAVSLQLLEGSQTIDLVLYVKRCLGYFLFQFACLAILACFFQVLAQSRLVGMVLMGVFLAVTVGSMDFLGIEHPLLTYGLGGFAAPLSDMNGEDRFTKAVQWLHLYWGGMAGLLLLASYVLWNRGIEQPMSYRLRKLRTFTSPGFALASMGFIAVFAASGAHIYFNTNLVNSYFDEDDRNQLRAQFEQRYRPYASLPMPRTTAIQLDVDLFPYQRRVEARGKQILTNKTKQPIEAVHLMFASDANVKNVSLQNGLQLQWDEDYNYFIFKLNTPLQPGETLELTYETHIHQQGFTHHRPDTRLVRNGTFIHDHQITPYIGFNSDVLIEDSKTRRAYGLEPLPRQPNLDDTAEYHNNISRQDSDFISFETTVSTVASQTALSVGDLIETWQEGDRRYFTYRSPVPIRNFFAYLSGEYQVLHERWQGIDIDIFHHPAHRDNLDRMMKGVKDSLAYFGTHFSPYQYKQVRIVEFPAYRTFAQAFPNTIPYSEGIGFVADVGADDIDMPYYVTAHEVSHQWWGHQLVPANTQGASFLNESLAQYSALLVMEEAYGPHQLRRFLKYELDRYLSGRADDAEGELPLYRVEGQEYIHYRKGSLVMYVLRDYLGTAVVNATLQKLLEERAYRSDPYAVSTDFLRILKREAGPEHLSLIEDLFEKITLFDLKLTSFLVERIEDGTFRVTLEIEARKYYADPLGVETEAPLDLGIDIGMFARHPDDTDFSESDVLMLQRVPVTSTTRKLEFSLPQKPTVAGIDPYHKLIDRNVEDNLRQQN